jgi:hypothetical protein
VTANEIDRGGRPRQFDEDELIARIDGFDDLVLIQAALVEHSSHPTWAQGCVDWLWRKRAGDPTGGKSRPSVTNYRRMLAELPHDPLRPPGGRRRALRGLAHERGHAELRLLAGGALAGAVALAVLSPSEAARAILVLAADNARNHQAEAGRANSGGSAGRLRSVGAGGAREYAPTARFSSPTPRGRCASVDEVHRLAQVGKWDQGLSHGFVAVEVHRPKAPAAGDDRAPRDGGFGLLGPDGVFERQGHADRVAPFDQIEFGFHGVEFLQEAA